MKLALSGALAAALSSTTVLAALVGPAARPTPGGDSVTAGLVRVPLSAEHWTATDSIRFETHLGRPSLYIDRGVALARGVELRDGVIELDIAATPRTTFLGVSFHASAHDTSEVIFFRVGKSGTSEAVQYGPALNSLGAAWQVFHGPGANAVANLARDRWIPVRIVVAGSKATVFLNGATEPTLIVPRLAGAGGRGLGVWSGLFGQGAYYSNIRYAEAGPPSPTPPAELPTGTIADWQLSQVLDAETLPPGILPNLSSQRWERVTAEPPGIVLVNRYRAAPVASLPVDPATRAIDVDAVMAGTVKGGKVVLARAEIGSADAGIRRMHFGYSDGVVIYCNGVPLFFGMNAQFFRGDGIMSSAGDAVYLPLRKGRNEIVFAVTEFTGGWAFWARLDP